MAVAAAATNTCTAAGVSCGIRRRQQLLLRVRLAPVRGDVVEEVHVEHGHSPPRRVLERVHVMLALHRKQHPRLVISVSLPQVSSLAHPHL